MPLRFVVFRVLSAIVLMSGTLAPVAAGQDADNQTQTGSAD